MSSLCCLARLASANLVLAVACDNANARLTSSKLDDASISIDVDVDALTVKDDASTAADASGAGAGGITAPTRKNVSTKSRFRVFSISKLASMSLAIDRERSRRSLASSICARGSIAFVSRSVERDRTRRRRDDTTSTFSLSHSLFLS